MLSFVARQTNAFQLPSFNLQPTAVTNFDSFDAPVEVQLLFPTEVSTFGGIIRLAQALGQVESARQMLGVPSPRFVFESRRSHRLLSFEVRSPPQVSVLADPAWHSVYIGLLGLGVSGLQLLGSYASVKSGAKELFSDLGRVAALSQEYAASTISSLRHLTAAHRTDLAIGVSLILAEFEESKEKFFEAVLLKAARLASVTHARRHRPSIEATVNSRR